MLTRMNNQWSLMALMSEVLCVQAFAPLLINAAKVSAATE